ncbi:hypothetical protein E2C01_035798 [Portunus trituberculatus]|uniref:Uncharacterized protein n=1 Tax=Portunus trituberculatus TaxID=210409 RepID=A0A5B7FCF6_PORTR|nr:hypothetical protein [Portunus trituberculatus]
MRCLGRSSSVCCLSSSGLHTKLSSQCFAGCSSEPAAALFFAYFSSELPWSVFTFSLAPRCCYMVLHSSILGSRWFICPGIRQPRLQMADPAGLHDSPLRPFIRSASPPRGRKCPSKDGAWTDDQQGKRDRRDPGRDSALQLASDSALAGPSQPRDVNSAGAELTTLIFIGLWKNWRGTFIVRRRKVSPSLTV